VSERRQVRVAQSFFDRLDELLPPERGPRGQPSTVDFLLHEMPTIIDGLAQDYEAVTTALTALSEVRVLITAGLLIPYIAVYAVIAPDHAIELIYLEIDNGVAGSSVEP
jgi:hypothetical protein